jgi:hypothetical protein
MLLVWPFLLEILFPNILLSVFINSFHGGSCKDLLHGGSGSNLLVLLCSKFVIPVPSFGGGESFLTNKCIGKTGILLLEDFGKRGIGTI